MEMEWCQTSWNLELQGTRKVSFSRLFPLSPSSIWSVFRASLSLSLLFLFFLLCILVAFFLFYNFGPRYARNSLLVCGEGTQKRTLPILTCWYPIWPQFLSSLQTQKPPLVNQRLPVSQFIFLWKKKYGFLALQQPGFPGLAVHSLSCQLQTSRKT